MIICIWYFISGKCGFILEQNLIKEEPLKLERQEGKIKITALSIARSWPSTSFLWYRHTHTQNKLAGNSKGIWKEGGRHSFAAMLFIIAVTTTKIYW